MGSKLLEYLENLGSCGDSPNDAPEDVKHLKALLEKILDDPEAVETVRKAVDSLNLNTLCELEKIGETSKSLARQCAVSYKKDSNAFSAKDETAETSPEIPVEPSKERKYYRVFMDVSNFKKNEVDVKVLGKHLVVHAKHGIITDGHGTISREFTRKFEIPEDVDVQTFRALIDFYYVLTVEALFKPRKVKEKKLVILKDSNGQTGFQPYEDLEQFKKLVESHIKDGEDLRDFAQNLAKLRPSYHIPLEEIV